MLQTDLQLARMLLKDTRADAEAGLMTTSLIETRLARIFEYVDSAFQVYEPDAFADEQHDKAVAMGQEHI